MTSVSRKTFIDAAVLCLLSAIPVSADVLYSNGPPVGNFDAQRIFSGYSVSDSFALSSDATVTGFDFTTWNYISAYGALPVVPVDWSIGTTDFGSDVASGTTALSSVFDFYNLSAFPYTINTNTASGLNLALAAGTYWLTLQNETPGIYWDENFGPSTAFSSSDPTSPIGSETFDILGSTGEPVSTPEPGSSVVLLGLGLLAMAVPLRRKV